MVPIIRQISKYNHYDYNNPLYISIHYVGGQSSTAKNNADYFCGGDRQASAQYFVDNTSIYQVVEDRCGSWAIGNTRTEVNNQNCINIEMCCMDANMQVSAQTEANTVDLVKMLMNKYGIKIGNVRTHYEISGGTKVCPNWNANGWQRWNNFKSKLLKDQNIKKEEYDKMLFSKKWYLQENPDVAKDGIDPREHYERFGRKEGRSPLPPLEKTFCEGEYLELNPDVNIAVKKGDFQNGCEHWLMFGFCENRKVRKPQIVVQDEELAKKVKELQDKLDKIKQVL